MTRPLICLDVETTGVDPEKDRIVSLAIVSVQGTVMFDRLINPGVPIPAEATEVHGITDADVAEAPTFNMLAKIIQPLLTGVDILGFALRKLDLPIIDAEFTRVGLEWEPGGYIIDAATIYHKHHPRTLSAAVMTYLHQSHDEAHGALADACATLDVFKAQLLHPDTPKDRASLAVYSRHGEEEPADLSGKLLRDKDGDLIFAFGKNKGLKVRHQRGYAEWMLGKDFPGNTKRVLADELERLDGPTLFNDRHTPATSADIPF